MSKKINIYIHPGYGKTGTTYLQESVFNNIGFVNLGKPHNQKNELINKLISLQYKIFQPKYSFQKLYPMNYSYSIKNYVSILKKIIDNSNNINFLFSDETLFDHINYFGYFNIHLLKEILDSLNNYFNIKIKFILSVRKQHEYLISFYAYDNYRMKKNFGSFDNFLNKVLSDQDISEIYQYDLLVNKIKKTFNTELLILPLEELEQNSQNYRKKIINFLGIQGVANIFDNKPLNKNSELVHANKIYNIKTFNSTFGFRNQILLYFSKLHISLKKYELYKNNFKYIKFFKQIIQPREKISGTIQLNENQKKTIKQHFKKSNQNLENIANLNLKIYNYYD